MEIGTGYFFIADITRYTRFLAGSELDHAKEILDALFDSILENIEPPLVVSNNQGDAIICYAPERDFIQPQTLLDTMESLTSVIQEDIESGKANPDQITASKSQRAAYSRPEVAKGRFGNLN